MLNVILPNVVILHNANLLNAVHIVREAIMVVGLVMENDRPIIIVPQANLANQIITLC